MALVLPSGHTTFTILRALYSRRVLTEERQEGVSWKIILSSVWWGTSCFLVGAGEQVGQTWVTVRSVTVQTWACWIAQMSKWSWQRYDFSWSWCTTLALALGRFWMQEARSSSCLRIFLKYGPTSSVLESPCPFYEVQHSMANFVLCLVILSLCLFGLDHCAMFVMPHTDTPTLQQAPMPPMSLDKG